LLAVLPLEHQDSIVLKLMMNTQEVTHRKEG
jgi:hypothetical protein